MTKTESAIEWVRDARRLYASKSSDEANILLVRATENAIKAALIYDGKIFDCSHDLPYLQSLLNDCWGIAKYNLDNPIIKAFSVRFIDNPACFSDTQENHDNTINILKAVYSQISDRFGKLGLKYEPPDIKEKPAVRPNYTPKLSEFYSIMELLYVKPEIKTLMTKTIVKIIKTVDPVEILLYGSYARNAVTFDSDIDLLITISNKVDLPDSHFKVFDIIKNIRPKFEGVVRSVAEIKHRTKICGNLEYYSRQEGIVLYRRV